VRRAISNAQADTQEELAREYENDEILTFNVDSDNDNDNNDEDEG
jgi:hypothetical protein